MAQDPRNQLSVRSAVDRGLETRAHPSTRMLRVIAVALVAAVAARAGGARSELPLAVLASFLAAAWSAAPRHLPDRRAWLGGLCAAGAAAALRVWVGAALPPAWPEVEAALGTHLAPPVLALLLGALALRD